MQQRTFRVNDGYEERAPSPQYAVDLIEGWASILPDFLNVKAGVAPLFNDPRVIWALDRLGGVKGYDVLELGPCEAAHTYMLQQAGAASITAIEASKRQYLKCLIVKELLDLNRAHFLFGNFIPWLEANHRKWDVIWASGVLYHMSDPLRFLELISEHTDKVYFWTHVVDEKDMPEGDPRRAAIVGTETIQWRGREITLYRRSYSNLGDPIFCGGIYDLPAWLHKSQVPLILRELGFDEIEIGLEHAANPAGPCYCIVAKKTPKSITQ